MVLGRGERSARRWSPIPACAWSRSPATSRPAGRCCRRRPRLKRTHLELGGKAPVIVFDDADLQAVVEGVRTFGYYNAGQDCTAACRIYAGPKIHDNLVADLASAVATIRYGDPTGQDMEIGPLISQAQRERRGLRRARRRGAPYRGGDRRQAGRRCRLLYQPTVVAGTRQEDEIVRKEVFGPVVSVTRFTMPSRRSPGRTIPTTASPHRSGPGTCAHR